ncbi:MAG: FxsA family protein [Firmicutes bacterium]|nr:FxsA family protein [Candidatus Fermentithermobacillaceae bacterium]
MGSTKTIVLILLILALPLVDLAVLLHVRKRLGVWRTLGAVIGAAVVGAGLLAVQGVWVLREVRREAAARRFPKNQLVDSLLMVIGAVLLLLPGPVTDVVGLLLLFPLTRIPLRMAFLRRVERYIYIDI